MGLCNPGDQPGIVQWQRQEPGSTEWESLGYFSAEPCPDGEDDAAAATPPGEADIREAATRLIAAPDGFEVQPPNLVSYVNADNIVYLNPQSQTHHDVILGFDVWIQASPAEFEWDFGDGTDPYVTTDPNRAYPDHSYSHIYHQPGDYLITLTTGWEASYSFTGPDGPWTSIDGYLTTINQSDPLTVRQLRSRLVNN